MLVSDSRPLRTPLKIHHRGAAYSFITPIYQDREHYERCRDFYDENFRGLPAKEMFYDGDVFDGIRHLTKTERERLQTMPEGYCASLTENEAADVLGDGWTVDVIAHIFTFIPKE